MMKRNTMSPLIHVFVLLICVSTPCLAGGGVPIWDSGTPGTTNVIDGPFPTPICYPGIPCAAQFFDGPTPICYPGVPCVPSFFDGPTPICFPGDPCGRPPR